MEKSADILFWLILPLLLILPFAAHAQTVHCKTELRRLCDSAQVCTRTTEIQPAVQYIVELREDKSSARITKTVDGKKVANWKAVRISGSSSSNYEYSPLKDGSSRFSLSESLVTFSYSVAARVGKELGESKEVGLCLSGTP
jgi:hypothetical protein